MYKRFIVLLGIFLGGHALAAAQTPPSQTVLAQVHVAPTITMLRTTPLLTASFVPYQDPGESTAPFSHLFRRVDERDHAMERLSPIEEIKTVFFTQWSLPLIQLWSGRLQLDAFQKAFHIQNVQLGPLGYGGMLDYRGPRQSYPGGPRSAHLSGLSLSVHFDQGARTGRPTQAWRSLSRIVGTALN